MVVYNSQECIDLLQPIEEDSNISQRKLTQKYCLSLVKVYH